MGTVHPLARHETASLGEAIDAYLATLAGPESAGTRRVYTGILRQLAAEYGADTDVAALQPEAVATWFGSRWGDRSPSRWNVALDALRSASRYWIDQGWLADDPARTAATPPQGSGPVPRAVPRRRRAAAHPRGHRDPRADVVADALRDRGQVGRGAPPRRRGPGPAEPAAKVRRKGGAIDVIVWQTGTARLLPRLLKGRKSGPVFLTDRRARVELPPGDIDQASGRARLSYRQAEDLFKAASGGATLHQLRHSRADPRRRGRGQHADADGEVRAHVGGQPGQVRAAVGRGPGPVAGTATTRRGEDRRRRPGRPRSRPAGRRPELALRYVLVFVIGLHKVQVLVQLPPEPGIVSEPGDEDLVRIGGQIIEGEAAA